MSIDKDIIIILIILIGLLIILIREFQSMGKQSARLLNRTNHKIIAVLIRHGGKMSHWRICSYLDLPSETVTARLAEMERRGIIYRNGEDNDDIYLKITG